MLASSYAGAAQDARMVSAADPQGIVDLLELTGREPQLGKDNVGDPKIDLDLAGYNATLLFYGCDADTHDKCDSLQLQAGFDRKKPWTAQEAIKVAERYRFASVQLDKEGDPWLQWDIVTGDGIPAKVFLASVEMFTDTVEDAANMVFEGED